MKKSLCLETIFTDYSLPERFLLAKKAGFDYVEFWGWQNKDLSQIKEICQNNSLKIAGFSGDQDYSLLAAEQRNLYLDFLEKSLIQAKFLEADYLIIHSNALGEDGKVLVDYTELSTSVKYINSYQTLTEAVKLAEKHEITLVLEALNTIQDHQGNFLNSTAEAAALVRAVKSPYLKILYDIYHMQLMEGNLLNTIENYFDVIDYIHIADSPGRNEPGTGEINYRQIFKKLRQLNYQGIAGFELFPLAAAEKVAANLINL